MLVGSDRYRVDHRQRDHHNQSQLLDWATVFGDAKMTTAQLDWLTHHCHISRLATTASASRGDSEQNAQRLGTLGGKVGKVDAQSFAARQSPLKPTREKPRNLTATWARNNINLGHLAVEIQGKIGEEINSLTSILHDGRVEFFPQRHSGLGSFGKTRKRSTYTCGPKSRFK